MEERTPTAASNNADPGAKKPARSKWLRRLRTSAIVFAVLAVLFGAFGYFAGPPLAKSALVKVLGQQLHRPVSIKAIHISPYAMSRTELSRKAWSKTYSPPSARSIWAMRSSAWVFSARMRLNVRKTNRTPPGSMPPCGAVSAPVPAMAAPRT